MPKFGSKDTNLYVSNQSGQRIYVIPVPNPDWEIADAVGNIVVSAALIAATGGAAAGGAAAAASGAAATGGAAAASGAVATTATVATTAARVTTIAQLVRLISMIDIVATGLAAVRGRMDATDTEESTHDREQLRNVLRTVKPCILIEDTDYKRVNDESLLKPWSYAWNVNGWGRLFDASTITLYIISEDLSRVAQFNTDSDAAWIVYRDSVVRAASGRIAVPDRSRGHFRIPNYPHLPMNVPLRPGECISSPDRKYDLVYQTDGNLEVRRRDGAKTDDLVWESRTRGKAPGKVLVQDDGNLVIYGPNNEVHAAINDYGSTPDHQHRVLRMQDDGNLVLYAPSGKAVWDTRHVGEKLQAR